MIKLKDLILESQETWNSDIWPSHIWNSDIWKSNLWPSDIWEDVDEDGGKKKPIKDRLGRCYELAGRYVMYHPKTILVLGELTNPFISGHPKMNHAWVEDGNEVFDPVMDKIWPKEVYESLFKAKIHKKYTAQEVYQITDKTGKWGPWDD